MGEQVKEAVNSAHLQGSHHLLMQLGEKPTLSFALLL